MPSKRWTRPLRTDLRWLLRRASDWCPEKRFPKRLRDVDVHKLEQELDGLRDRILAKNKQYQAHKKKLDEVLRARDRRSSEYRKTLSALRVEVECATDPLPLRLVARVRRFLQEYC